MFKFRQQWPDGVLGGTGTTSNLTVEQLIGDHYEHYDYSGYPEFSASIGLHSAVAGCREAVFAKGSAWCQKKKANRGP